VSKLPSTSAPRDWRDLIAFLAVLLTGMLLIILGHMTAGGLTTVCAALVGLYAAWNHFRPVHDGRQSPPARGSADEQQDSDAQP
jgi:hypothetical protein